MDLQGFNANDHGEMADFSALPKGWYLMMITADEQKASQSNPNSKYMALTFDVVDGPLKGRKLFQNLNLWNAGANAQKTIEIAQRELAAICKAVNIPNPQNSEQLHNIPMGVHIGHQKDKQTGEMRERVKGYCSEREFAQKATGNPVPTTTANTGGGAPAAGPWAAPGTSTQ